MLVLFYCRKVTKGPHELTQTLTHKPMRPQMALGLLTKSRNFTLPINESESVTQDWRGLARLGAA